MHYYRCTNATCRQDGIDKQAVRDYSPNEMLCGECGYVCELQPGGTDDSIPPGTVMIP